MKRYGDNLESNSLDELEHTSNQTVQHLAGNCAVRQDMVAFLMPKDSPGKPQKHKAWNIISLFRIGQKKIKGNGD
jgi:hypothetical protein